MKAKTKNQKEVVCLNSRIKKPSQKIFDWAFSTCLDKLGIQYPSGTTNCMECGHTWKPKMQSWQEEVAGWECPNCKNKLLVSQTNKRTAYRSSVFAIISKVGPQQVYRVFQAEKKCKVKEKPKIIYQELFRIFINGKGDLEYVGKFVWSTWNNNWSGEIKLRNSDSIKRHGFACNFEYFTGHVIPELKIRGYNGILPAKLDTYSFFKRLIQNPKIETLYKNGYYSVIQESILYLDYWPTIKIVMKNKYQIKNGSDYHDYLTLLSHFNKDLNNPKYVCPEDFKHAHDRYVKRKRDQDRKIKIETMKAKLKEEQIVYSKKIAKFKNLVYKQESITIEILKSAKEAMILGDMFNHCIYTNEYHKKHNTLMFVAFYNCVPMETAEYSLNQMKIIQSRGQNNDPSSIHSDVIKAMNSKEFRKLIEERLKPVKKQNVKQKTAILCQ